MWKRKFVHTTDSSTPCQCPPMCWPASSINRCPTKRGYECFFDALRMAGRFLPFTAPYLTNMCIKEADSKVQRRIAGLVNKLMDKLAKGGSTDAIEREIDSELYSLYALSAAETQQVNDCFEAGGVMEDAEVLPEDIEV